MEEDPRRSKSQDSMGMPVPSFDENLDNVNVIKDEERKPLLYKKLTGDEVHRKMVEDPDRTKLIDARFDYEYEGGRIKTAINFQTFRDLTKFYSNNIGKDIDIIFYCEFSQHRSVEIIQHFRNYDREQHCYPEHTFPNLFLLTGGFKTAFYETNHICEGTYVPMRDPRYQTILSSKEAFFRKEFVLRKTSIMRSKSLKNQREPKVSHSYDYLHNM